MQTRKRILLIDDLPTNLTLFKTMLELEGYRVQTALGGEQARHLMSEQDFDVIFLDVMMPGTDGLSLCRSFKQDRHLKEIPIIFLTALLDERTRLDGFAAGADAFLTKPATFSQLNRVIEGVLDKNKRYPGDEYYAPTIEHAYSELAQ